MIERILAKIPANWLVFFASWGLWSYDTYGKVSKQFWRSYMSLMGSFMDEIVGWPLDSPYPSILTDYYPRGVFFYDVEYYTKFNISQQQILFVDQNKEQTYEVWKNPYLAISILENGTEIADMSEWLEKIKVYYYKNSEYFYPLHSLLLCYAYEHTLKLKYSDMNKYTFSVITESGECEIVDIHGRVVLQEEDTQESKEMDESKDSEDITT